jgi:hypothetical protein
MLSKVPVYKETVRSSALQYLEILRNAMLRFVTQGLQVYSQIRNLIYIFINK